MAACKALKRIVVTIMKQEYLRRDWCFDFDGETFNRFFFDMAKEMRKSGVAVSVLYSSDSVIQVNSYADLLNCVKVSSPDDGHGNQCVGHIIGKSENLDIMEDLQAAVRRIAFAPETIAPASEFRKVCHNCGCGC